MTMYLSPLLGIRLAGKRQLAQLNPFDLVVLLVLSNTVQNAIIGEDNTVLGGMIGATTLLILNYAVNRLLYGHRRLEALIEGEPDVIIEDGKVNEEHLKNELITKEELEAAARRQGFDSLADVRRAVLESGGTISFKGMEPATDELRHRELLAMMHELKANVAEMHKLHADLVRAQGTK